MTLQQGLPQELAMAGGQVLVVCTGSIGCELLKNLVLTGLSHIDLIDLAGSRCKELCTSFFFFLSFFFLSFLI
uniref:THIF-type NAD/FAD binding fold domain-containing protein n=1 Tax=Catagonus wagneri TaxID=51154 RepID=A0A8C3YVS3_9CETA